MKSTIFCFLYLLLFQVEDQPAHEFHWKEMKVLGFNLPKEEYKSDSIYFFHTFLKKEDVLNPALKESSFHFTEHAKPLDLYDYWGSRGEENYDVLFTKTAYVLNQSIDFFSEERLSDVEYLAKTIPTATISKTDSIYHIAMGFGAPEIDYTLQFYSDSNFQSNYSSLNGYFIHYDQLNVTPELVVLQHNFKYGQVMFQNTSKMSISISRYFARDNEQTLVVNYTLNYIHNLPPAFLGGSNFLINKIKEGIKALIEDTQSLCDQTM